MKKVGSFLKKVVVVIWQNLKKTEKALLKKVKISKILIHLFLLLILLCLFLYDYIDSQFYNVTFDQLLYNATMSEGTGEGVIISGVKYILPRVILVYVFILILGFIIKKLRKKKISFNLFIRNKKITFSIFPFSNAFKVFLCFIILIGSLYYYAVQFEVFAYFSNSSSNAKNGTDLFDDYYVDGKNAEIKAPKNEQNLIYIYVESLESSMVTEKNGGAFNRKVVPTLEKLAQNNINFSQNDKIGGAYMPSSGASWTVAGMVSSTAGVPLKVSLDNNLYRGYGEFLPGAYSLGEVLEKNGYNNYLFIGSDADFGGRKDYFTYHGNYKIYDLIYARENGWIDKDYNVWWGYEDGKMFEFAKDTLKEIAKENEPFNFTLLTTGTHFTDGFVENSCDTPFDEKYLNAYHCTDEILTDFLNWLKKQDFYNDTTIIITGDHLTMQANMVDFFDIKDKKNYDRTIYNVFINSKINTLNRKNREFTTFDFYPTILASLGFEIEGERLGLGTNLFSSKKTITEEIGLDEFNDLLKGYSNYYEEYILNNFNERINDN